MASPKQPVEKRATFRCPVPAARQEAELQAGESWLRVQLLDESSGGVAALAESASGLTRGTVTRLKAAGSELEVKVVYICPIDAASLPQGSVITGTEPVRIGLQRLRDLTKLSKTAAPSKAERRRSGRTPQLSSGMSFWLLGVAMATLVIAIPMALLGVKGGDGRSSLLSPVVRWVRQATPWTARQSSSESPQAPSGSSQTDAVTVASSQPKPKSEFGKKLDEMPGAIALTLPKVIHDLRLTTVQQERIGRIMEMTNQAMRSFEAADRPEQWERTAHKRTQLLQAARREALEILNPQQRARWNAIVEGRPLDDY
jgi:hypothetical protein